MNVADVGFHIVAYFWRNSEYRYRDRIYLSFTADQLARFKDLATFRSMDQALPLKL